MTLPHAPAPFTVEIPVRWSDQDRNAHVNNAVVVTLIEEARIQAMRALIGSTPDDALPRVVRSLAIDYLLPVHFGRALEASVWITRLGNSSYTMRHVLSQAGRVCVQADAVIVQLNAEATASHPLSRDYRTILEGIFLPAD